MGKKKERISQLESELATSRSRVAALELRISAAVTQLGMTPKVPADVTIATLQGKRRTGPIVFKVGPRPNDLDTPVVGFDPCTDSILYARASRPNDLDMPTTGMYAQQAHRHRRRRAALVAVPEIKLAAWGKLLSTPKKHGEPYPRYRHRLLAAFDRLFPTSPNCEREECQARQACAGECKGMACKHELRSKFPGSRFGNCLECGQSGIDALRIASGLELDVWGQRLGIARGRSTDMAYRIRLIEKLRGA